MCKLLLQLCMSPFQRKKSYKNQKILKTMQDTLCRNCNHYYIKQNVFLSLKKYIFNDACDDNILSFQAKGFLSRHF